MSRIIGIDWGTRRIGLSAGEMEVGLAFPIEAATQEKEGERMSHLLELIKKEHCKTVVIGYPYHMNGDAGEMVMKVDRFIENLQQEAPGLEIVKLDERLSSQAADQLSLPKKRQTPQDKIKERKSGVRDSRAATVILQDYFDQQSKDDLLIYPDELEY